VLNTAHFIQLSSIILQSNPWAHRCIWPIWAWV